MRAIAIIPPGMFLSQPPTTRHAVHALAVDATSRSRRRSPRATPANTSCLRCPCRCRRSPSARRTPAASRRRPSSARHRAIDQRLDAGVARIHRAVAVGDADDRLLEIAVAEADGAQHRAVGRAGDALRDQAGAAVVTSLRSNPQCCGECALGPRGTRTWPVPAPGHARLSPAKRADNTAAAPPATSTNPAAWNACNRSPRERRGQERSEHRHEMREDARLHRADAGNAVAEQQRSRQSDGSVPRYMTPRSAVARRSTGQPVAPPARRWRPVRENADPSSAAHENERRQRQMIRCAPNELDRVERPDAHAVRSATGRTD